jgi:hypothetical protein
MTVHSSLGDAVASIMDRQKQKAQVQDVSAEDIIALALKRTLVPKDVEGLGRVYVYEPQSVAERDSYHKHIRFNGTEARISLEGMVDGIIARVRNSKGEQLFTTAQRDLVMRFSNEVIQSIWNALGEEQAITEEQAAKK